MAKTNYLAKKNLTIMKPGAEKKDLLLGHLGEINRKSMQLCDAEIVHGAMPGKSLVTNAIAHIGYLYTLTMSLQDYFEAVTPAKVKGKLTKMQIYLCFEDGVARQGLPTSPPIANLAAAAMDKALQKCLDKTGEKIVYTRYADHLTFSFDNPDLIPLLPHQIGENTTRCGFKVNPDLTRLQCSTSGRRIICGIGTGQHDIFPTRKTKRRLRAARHQHHQQEARGLEEWIKLKPPKKKELRGDLLQEEQIINEMRKLWKLPPVDIKKAWAQKVIPEQALGDSVFITNDPVLFMGMSTLTTGWKNCMKVPDGFYGHGVIAWLELPGTSIGALFSRRTTRIGKVERRQMRARCLLHLLRDGTRVYDKMYGNPEDIPLLVKKIEAAGYLPITDVAPGLYVEGSIPARLPVPFLDNLAKEFLMLDKKPRHLFLTKKNTAPEEQQRNTRE